MLRTREELLEKIRLGEDSFLEFKDVRFSGTKIRGPKQDDLADEIAAFANARGGVLLLGIDDETREPVGIPVERLDAVETQVRQACQDSVRPPMAPDIERLMLPDGAGVEQPVIRVDVPSSLYVHQSPGGYFHRVGSSKRPIDPEQLARLVQQRSRSLLIRFDETPIPQATLADLDESLWRRFASPRSADPPDSLLHKLAMAAKDDAGVWRPTLAGVLLASRAPEHFVSGAFIQAVAYRGKTISATTMSAYQLDARDISGPLDQQILEATHFVRTNMKVAATKLPEGGRIDFPQFDMIAVFEAIANAAAHRDYSMTGSKIRLRVFADRLELFTPGTLVNTMTPESLRYRQAARNETVTSLLARCPVPEERADIRRHRTHIMDRRGEGVPIILDRSETLSGRAPEYRLIDQSELLLTIYAASPP